MPIKPIDSTISKQISSSASVDSPLAAIKELLDNAIDSDQTTAVSIEIDKKTGGLDYIKVKDNGSGIHPEDRSLMCLKGYTSKISSIEDLQSVKSLGFRGEALNSICNLTMGNVSVITMCCGEDSGIQWFVDENGNVRKDITAGVLHFKTVPTTRGTTVLVKNLFSKFPVRRRILMKTKSQSLKAIESLIRNYSISHHTIRFELRFSETSSQSVTTFLPTSSSSKSFQAVFHKQHVKFLTVDFELSDPYKFRVTFPTGDVHSPVKLLLFDSRILNNSLGISKILLKHLKQAFESVDMAPPACVLIEMISHSGADVDVNIESKKDDVLIKNIDTIAAYFLLLLKDKLKTLTTPKESESNIPPGRQPDSIKAKTSTSIDEAPNHLAKSTVRSANSNHQKTTIGTQVETSLRNDLLNILGSDDDMFRILDESDNSKEPLIPGNCSNGTDALDAGANNELTMTPSKDHDIESDTESNEGDWSKSMYDKLSSQSNAEELIPSDPATSGVDEDFKISRLTEISNPFTLSKLQASKSKTVQSVPAIIKPIKSHIPSPESSFSNLQRAKRQIIVPDSTTTNPRKQPKRQQSKPSAPTPLINATPRDVNQSTIDSFLANLTHHSNSLRKQNIDEQAGSSQILMFQDLVGPENPLVPNTSASLSLNDHLQALHNLVVKLPINHFTKFNNTSINVFELYEDRDFTNINDNISSYIESFPEQFTFLLCENEDFFYITLDENQS